MDCLKDDFPAEAAFALEKAAKLGCTKDYLHYNLALAFSRSGQAEAADENFRRAAGEDRIDREGDSFFLRNLYALPDISLAELKQHAMIWSERHAAQVQPFTHVRSQTSSTVLNVGFLSSRFRRHAVGFLSLGALEHLDKSRFEIHLFSSGGSKDDYTDRFFALAKEVHDISTLSDQAAAELIRAKSIDILIDMAGHSAGSRLGVMARKPAPVLAKWVGGQHGTTGLGAIDFFITDETETPPDNDVHFVETPIRLPNSYGVYTPPFDAPPVNNLPCGSDDTVTFGSFNNITKISRPTVKAWSRILNAVPGSRLVLKHFALSENRTRDRLAALFLAHGVSPSRLILRPPTEQTNHMANYHDIDIALDPFPWSGCVTTCESLWMGVPVLALPGVAFCHRHSASFLSTIGLHDWIANDIEAYVEKAVGFAEKRESLKDLRQSLRERMRSSALCDAPGFARDFERLLAGC